MTAIVKGSFQNTGPSAMAIGTLLLGQGGLVSEPLVIPTQKGLLGTYQMKVTIPNNAGASGGPSVIDASNTVKTQKSTDNGRTWADVTTYNSAQLGTLVTVAGPDNIPATLSEQWRLALVAQQVMKSMEYELSLELKYTTGSTYV